VDNTKKLRTLSLCAGYGGVEQGLELIGEALRVVAYAEIEAYACANLVEKMEQGELGSAPIWTDLKTLPLEPFRGRIDLLTGGYPCQPFSSAGRRLGKDDPRHLWPWVCRIIDGVMPRMCFFENVEGHISLGLRQVLSDLEARGYETKWGIFSAEECGGAPHRRKRVFILADRDGRGVPISTQRGKSSVEMFRGNGEKGRVKWPSKQGELQFEWEEPRSVEGKLNPNWVEQLMGLPVGWTGDGPRADRLRLLGNGVVPHTAAKAWVVLNERFR